MLFVNVGYRICASIPRDFDIVDSEIGERLRSECERLLDQWNFVYVEAHAGRRNRIQGGRIPGRHQPAAQNR